MILLFVAGQRTIRGHSTRHIAHEVSGDTSMIEFDDFSKIDIRVGTVTDAEPNAKARHPAYILTIDFGPLGVKVSSAQLTEHYTAKELVGLQVVAVMNFQPKRVAGVKSEVLVLASTGKEGTILISPVAQVANGSRIG